MRRITPSYDSTTGQLLPRAVSHGLQVGILDRGVADLRQCHVLVGARPPREALVPLLRRNLCSRSRGKSKGSENGAMDIRVTHVEAGEDPGSEGDTMKSAAEDGVAGSDGAPASEEPVQVRFLDVPGSEETRAEKMTIVFTCTVRLSASRRIFCRRAPSDRKGSELGCSSWLACRGFPAVAGAHPKPAPSELPHGHEQTPSACRFLLQLTPGWRSWGARLERGRPLTQLFRLLARVHITALSTPGHCFSPGDLVGVIASATSMTSGPSECKVGL